MISAGVRRLFPKRTPVRVRTPRRALGEQRPVLDAQTGFLRHPPACPVELRRKWFESPLLRFGKTDGRIGIIFTSDDYFPPDALVEVCIPVRDHTERFTGRVVLVRRREDYFEIGLWLERGDDAGRARIVEQICHIEHYLKLKKYLEGPYNLDPERVASEWITKYAADVPIPVMPAGRRFPQAAASALAGGQ